MDKIKNIEFIIFDLDGTLVDSREDIVASVNFTLRNIGLKERAKQEILSYVGSGIEDLIEKSLGENKSDLLSKALSIFEKYYKKHSADKTVLYPGVKDIVGPYPSSGYS